jgi:predicted RNase H-like nuclease (RuvC/YqgF family)
MNRGGQTLSVMMVIILGVWGCARGPVGPSGQAERLRAVEAKCSKLEDDYRAVATARDQARKQVAALEAERARLQKDLADKQSIMQERDDLRQQVTMRISERDNLQVRCDRLKKGLQNLLGQDDAQLTPSLAPTSTHSAAPMTLPTKS